MQRSPCSYSFAHSEFPKEALLASCGPSPQFGPLDTILGGSCIGVYWGGLQHTTESVTGWESLGLVGWYSPWFPLFAPSGPRIGGSSGVRLLPAPELGPHRPLCTPPLPQWPLVTLPPRHPLCVLSFPVHTVSPLKSLQCASPNRTSPREPPLQHLRVGL